MPFPLFSWTITSSPACDLILLGYLYLFFFPRARVLALDVIDMLCRVIPNLVELLWTFVGASPQRELQEQLRSQSAEIALLTQKRDEFQVALDGMMAQKAQLAATNDQQRLDLAVLRKSHDSKTRQIEDWQQRDKLSPVYQEQEQLLDDVKYDQDELIKRARHLDAEVATLRTTVKSKTSSEVDALRSIREAAGKESELNGLMAQLKSDHHQELGDLNRQIHLKDLRLGTLQRVVGVLHRLASEADLTSVSIAAYFAEACRLDGIPLEELGIDVANFQVASRLVARLVVAGGNSEPAAVSGQIATQTFIAAGHTAEQVPQFAAGQSVIQAHFSPPAPAAQPTSLPVDGSLTVAPAPAPAPASTNSASSVLAALAAAATATAKSPAAPATPAAPAPMTFNIMALPSAPPRASGPVTRPASRARRPASTTPTATPPASKRSYRGRAADDDVDLWC